jgi:hypothetical protein
MHHARLQSNFHRLTWRPLFRHPRVCSAVQSSCQGPDSSRTLLTSEHRDARARLPPLLNIGAYEVHAPLAWLHEKPASPMELSSTREAPVVKPLEIFPAFYRIRKSSPPVPILSQTHPTPPRSILILCIYLRLDLASVLFPSRFPTNNLYMFLFSSIRATCSASILI